MVVYFSATGNSRFAAQTLAHALGDELCDLTPLLRSGERSELCSEKPWVFVAPIYAWRLPRIVERFLKNTRLIGSRKAYFVLTCGSDVGGAGKHLESLCAELSLDYHGLLEVVMGENYIAMFRAPDAEETKKLAAAAREKLLRASEHIRASEPFPEQRSGALGGLKSGLVNRVFYRFFIKSAGFCATEKCIGCGKCAALCPLSNIRLEGGRPVWGKDCTHCMACICHCPTEAIEYGKKTQGKRRYRFPEEFLS